MHRIGDNIRTADKLPFLSTLHYLLSAPGTSLPWPAGQQFTLRPLLPCTANTANVSIAFLVALWLPPLLPSVKNTNTLSGLTYAVLTTDYFDLQLSLSQLQCTARLIHQSKSIQSFTTTVLILSSLLGSQNVI